MAIETTDQRNRDQQVTVSGYDAWLQSQVQEAIDDTTPSFSHNEVLADWELERAQLLKQIEVLEA